MSAARRSGGAPASAAARGGALILMAVVIGALLLNAGYSEEGGLIAAGSDDTTVDDTTDDTTADDPGGDDPGTEDPGGDDPGTDDPGTEEPGGEDPTTDTTDAAPEVRANEDIHAVVLNGSGVNGAAGAVTDALNAANYVTGEPSNVPTGDVEASRIFHAEGWQLEAEKVATELGVGAEVTAPLPPPFEYDMGEATILVVLGTDGVISAP